MEVRIQRGWGGQRRVCGSTVNKVDLCLMPPRYLGTYVVLVRRLEGSPECGHTVQCSYVRHYGAGACFVLLITLGLQQVLMGMGMQRLRTQ
jgi:hypothetical protein